MQTNKSHSVIHVSPRSADTPPDQSGGTWIRMANRFGQGIEKCRFRKKLSFGLNQ
jgi:hypothetical protein